MVVEKGWLAHTETQTDTAADTHTHRHTLV